MKTISVTDLKLIDGLAHLNYMEMVHPSNDELVNNYLQMLGFDIDKPLEYRAYQHRNLQGQIVINYVIAGELLLDREHLTGPFGSLEDRMIAASLQDKSLFAELHSMGHTCPSYGSDGALDQEIPTREYEEYREEEQRVTEQIKQLEDLLFHIRGSQYKSNGELKTAWDYKNPEVPVVKKKRKKKLKQEVEGSVNG
jgi:hypothetical protein